MSIAAAEFAAHHFDAIANVENTMNVYRSLLR